MDADHALENRERPLEILAALANRRQLDHVVGDQRIVSAHRVLAPVDRQLDVVLRGFIVARCGQNAGDLLHDLVTLRIVLRKLTSRAPGVLQRLARCGVIGFPVRRVGGLQESVDVRRRLCKKAGSDEE